MKIFLPLILIATSIAVFVFYTNKTYDQIKTVQAETAEYTKALDKSREVLKKRSELAEQYKSFSQQNIDNLQKLLPDHVDNIQLILDMDGIAKSKGIELKNINIQEERGTKDQTLGPSKGGAGSLLVSFRTTSSYDNFLAFLARLEQSMRIVDVTALSFRSTDNGIYDYSMTIKTYWLK